MHALLAAVFACLRLCLCLWGRVAPAGRQHDLKLFTPRACRAAVRRCGVCVEPRTRIGTAALLASVAWSVLCLASTSRSRLLPHELASNLSLGVVTYVT